jgi:hypothetical protein
MDTIWNTLFVATETLYGTRFSHLDEDFIWMKISRVFLKFWKKIREQYREEAENERTNTLYSFSQTLSSTDSR